MSNYIPHDGLQQHERDFLRIRSQCKEVAGLDAARSLIRQCRLVRYRRALELTMEVALKDQAKAMRAGEVENAFLHPQTKAAKEVCVDGQTITVAEAIVLQSAAVAVPGSTPVKPEPIAA